MGRPNTGSSTPIRGAAVEMLNRERTDDEQTAFE
jgi:hypothetical protein